MDKHKGKSHVMHALGKITSLEEIEGFISAIRNPDLETIQPTDEEWRHITEKRMAFLTEGRR